MPNLLVLDSVCYYQELAKLTTVLLAQALLHVPFDTIGDIIYQILRPLCGQLLERHLQQPPQLIVLVRQLQEIHSILDILCILAYKPTNDFTILVQLQYCLDSTEQLYQLLVRHELAQGAKQRQEVGFGVLLR